MKHLTDFDRMPFGIHFGTPLQDVPADYLHYLWKGGLRARKDSDVGDYIRRNLDALRQKNPGLIWS